MYLETMIISKHLVKKNNPSNFIPSNKSRYILLPDPGVMSLNKQSHDTVIWVAWVRSDCPGMIQSENALQTNQ